MTYMATPTRRVRRRSSFRSTMRPTGLGGWLEDLKNSLEGHPNGSDDPAIQVCLAQANANTAAMDAKTADLIRNWNPGDYFTPTDIRKGVSATMALVMQAQNDLEQVAAQWNSSQSDLQGAMGILSDRGRDSLAFLEGAATADASGAELVEAPGFKRWVTGTMTDVSNAAVAASVVACGIPTWLSMLQVWQSGFDAAINILKTIYKIAKQVGQTVVDVADDLGMFYDILKWGALAGVLYYGYLFVKKRGS